MEAKILEVPFTPLDFQINFTAKSYQNKESKHLEIETFPAK